MLHIVCSQAQNKFLDFRLMVGCIEPVTGENGLLDNWRSRSAEFGWNHKRLKQFCPGLPMLPQRISQTSWKQVMVGDLL